MRGFGCLFLLLVVMSLCVMPLIFVDAMNEALDKLHLSPFAAAVTIFGIFAGSLINLPIYRFSRPDPQPLQPVAMFGPEQWLPLEQGLRLQTTISVNVGGCLIPLSLAAWELSHVIRAGQWPLTALCLAAVASITSCYQFARPVAGVGIATPALAAPLASILIAWLTLGTPEYHTIRAPVAFIAGVLGPLVGADLLHIREIQKVPISMLSIGGAGTFDGIVISGLVAAYLA